MPDPANEPLPIPNSEQEYLNGVADDGSPLNIVSKHLNQPRSEGEKPIPAGIGKADNTAASPHHVAADKKILQAQQDHVQRVRECVEVLRGAVALGEPARAILAKDAEIALADREIELADRAIELEIKRRKLERLKAAPIDEIIEGEEGSDASGIAVPAMSDRRVPRLPARQARGGLEPEAPDTHCRDGNATGPAATRAPREPRVRHIKFSAAVLLTLALRAAKDLPKLSAELCELEARLRPAEAEAKLKEDFYQDKGVSVVCDTLISMDKAFGELGFGHWMPFRYPDQWLMFGGLLQRVLAAHGLVPSGNAAIYRKLMDETPSISPVAADAGPPKSWGQAYRNRELKNMKHLLARVADVRAGRGPPL